MTQRDFATVAEAINRAGKVSRDSATARALLSAAQYIADHCDQDELNFDRARFIAACFAYQKEA